MKVAFDATIPFDREITGIGVTVCHLLRHLSRMACQDLFEVYLPRRALSCPILPHAHNIYHVPVGWDRNLLSRVRWEFFELPKLVERRGNDVLCSPNNFYLPLRSAIPAVLVVHDLSFVYSPASYSHLQRFYYKMRLRVSLRTATAIVTISESTKKALLRHCSDIRAPIVVIPHGVPSLYPADSSAWESGKFHMVNLPRHFILAVGTHPRKNLNLIARAVKRLRMDSWFADLCLVVVGPERFVPLEWRDKAQTCDYSRPIIYLGFVPTSALPDLYRAALAYVTASNDEGFGLTILEAMSNDTPVICSDIPAHREVAGAAAEFFEPNSEDSLVDSLRKVLGNAQLRQRLIAAGKENLKRFTWEACAQSYLELFHSLIS